MIHTSYLYIRVRGTLPDILGGGYVMRHIGDEESLGKGREEAVSVSVGVVYCRYCRYRVLLLLSLFLFHVKEALVVLFCCPFGFCGLFGDGMCVVVWFCGFGGRKEREDGGFFFKGFRASPCCWEIIY